MNVTRNSTQVGLTMQILLFLIMIKIKNSGFYNLDLVTSFLQAQDAQLQVKVELTIPCLCVNPRVV